MQVNLKALISKVNPEVRATLEAAAGFCLSRTHYDMELEHYLIKLTERTGNDFDLLARHFSLKLGALTQAGNSNLDKLKAGNPTNPAFGLALLDMLTEAWVIASLNYGETEIRTAHTVMALLAKHVQKLGQCGVELAVINADILSSNFRELVRESSESSAESKVTAQSAGVNTSTRFFISYRHNDAGHSAGRVGDHLTQAFGKDRVFIDVARLQPGELYAVVLADAIDQCDAIIAVIGRHWNQASGRGGRRRLEEEDDWVRLELSMAIEKGKRIIPCTVDGAKPPRTEDLPTVLADVARRQGLDVSQNQFERDMAGLVELLKRIKSTGHASSRSV